MKRKLYYVVLAAEAIVCAALVVARAAFGGAFSAAMAFPFEQIGAGLRALSLSGDVGNAAAVAIYAALSLLPAAVLPFIGRRRKLFAEDWLLGLLSVSLFAVLYFMVNPGVINTFTGGAAGQAVGKAVLGSVAYSIVCGYFVLRALRMFFQSDARKLTQHMSVALGALAATVLTSIGFNLLQLLFVKTLMIVNVSVNIPVVSVAFVLAALMLTRFVAENKRLKDDNDMFI